MSDLKSEFLLDPGVAYLNHGAFGATPLPVFREYQRWQRELERQPTEFLDRRHNQLMRTARAALAKYLGAEEDDLVFTQNATVSVNMVARSLRLGPDDEVLASDHEYGACDRTWRFLSQKRGFTYTRRHIPVPLPPRAELVENFWAGVTPRTRVIFLSHITSPTAILLPVGEICQRARKAGIYTLIDGAHAPGQIPLDLCALDADFYAGNLHKWLCAPKGTGFLHARKSLQPLLEPLVVSWGFEPEKPGSSPFVELHQWTGTRDIAAFLSVPAAIEFQFRHSWEQVRMGCHLLLESALRRIADLTRLESLYPDASWYVQMGSAPLPDDVDLERTKAHLYDEYRIEVPLTAWNGRKLIRVSIQGYNAGPDVDRLLHALSQLL